MRSASVKARLEDVLKEKERELKLNRRFLNLRSYCEETLFPGADAPLLEHTAALKGIVEQLIPDPKDRTEEMFSGEVFTLLCAIYLHDLSLIKRFDWPLNEELLNSMENAAKGPFINYEIGKRLDIPAKAIEAANIISYSHIVKPVTADIEIIDENSKAIIRNMKALEHLFNFAHLLVDVFFTGLPHCRLKRYREAELILRPREAILDIDGREGIISIQYNARLPYEVHALDTVRPYMEAAFNRFRDRVNGKYGFQYRQIVWVITSDYYSERDVFEIPKFSPYRDFEGPPVERWQEASVLLDKLFKEGCVLMTGDGFAGKTTLLTSFVVPQLMAVYHKVYYCEVWSHPTREMRDVIGKKSKIPRVDDLDIISMCRENLAEGPCFFIIDGLEKVAALESTEKEKLVRFIDFALSERGIYLVLCGDKGNFFDWYKEFQGMGIREVYEVKSLEGIFGPPGMSTVQSDNNGGDQTGQVEGFRVPATVEQALGESLKGCSGETELPLVLAVLVGDPSSPIMKRYGLEELYDETGLPMEDLEAIVSFLQDKGILTVSEFRGNAYYALSGRSLRKPLYRTFCLESFEEKRMLRNIIGNFIVNETFLDESTLEIVERWKDRMTFSKEEMGIILGSLIWHGMDHGGLFEKANRDERGIDIQPILKLLYSKSEKRRKSAITLLVEIRDKDMINPLLLHLKEENVLEIRDLVIQGIGLTGKKRAIIAIMNTLKEIGDASLRLRAIEFFHSLFGENAERLLRDIRELEDDPDIKKRIDSLLTQ